MSHAKQPKTDHSEMLLGYIHDKV